MGPPFQAWHDFFTLVGTAAATLVGLMFVAASVGTGVFTQERQVGMRTFLSPTVVAFSVVLGTSLVGVAPLADVRAAGLSLVAIGGFAAVYSWRVWRRMVANGMLSKIDTEDRAWYVVVPALAYCIMAASGAMLMAQRDSAGTLAVGIVLLLLAGVRNAWDMTTWVVLKRRD